MPAKNQFEDLESGYEGVGEFYDLFADNSDIPFFLQYAREVGSPILDLAAGTGRVAFALARDGFNVVAIEQSKSMLSVARRKLEDSSEDIARRIQLIEGSMKNFSLNKKFPLVIVPNSFGHLLTTDDQLSMLRCVREHLADDGIFILDLYPGAHQYEQASFQDPPVKLPDGCSVTRFGEIKSDFAKQIMRVELRYVVNTADSHFVDEIRVVSGAALIFNREADLLIRMSDMSIENEFGDFKKNPYTPDSGRRVFILRKQT
jgi:SAM-dependent methyltransferase